MSEQLPRITAAEAVKALEGAGFVLARHSGSHKIFKKEKGLGVTVPDHSGKTLRPKIFEKHGKDADLTREESKDIS